MIPEHIFDDTIEEIAGSDVITLLDFIKGKSLVSEFKIAEKLNLTVNHVRNMLYRLDAHNLVDFAKKKDKKKGWYVYFWTLDLMKLRDLAVKMKTEKIRQFNDRKMKEEKGEFFSCPDKHIRMNQENAMEYGFKCRECDLPLVMDDNKKMLGLLRKQIEKLTKEVEILKALDIKPVVERKLERAPKIKIKKEAKKKKYVKKKKGIFRRILKKKIKKRKKK